MARSRGPQSLGEALSRLIKDLGFENKFKEQEVLDQWSQVVGDQIAKHSRAVSCEGGKLFVEVDSAAWRHELIYMKSEIIQRVNRAAQQNMVRDIILTNRRR